MKKQWLVYVLSGLLCPIFFSCISEDNDIKWRDNNLAFMEEVSNREGILVIGDSLNGFPAIYYEVIQSGDSTSKRPIIGNIVRMAYEGWLYNDTTSFDSDDDYQFRVGSSTIDGWSIVVQNMRVGDSWRVYIPYHLAYGSSASGSIPAYSALIFNLHLIEITSDN
jgi:FKBP-type peptidyl-prolyl cis-trans isomerase